MQIPIHFYFVPVFFLLIVAEIWWRVRWRGLPFDWKAAAASVVVYLGSIAAGVLGPRVPSFAYERTFSLAPWQFRMDSMWDWVILFFATEFLYYWRHRTSHSIRWMWATHAVHHSTEELNLTASARLPWTATISGFWLFQLPLFMVGFDLPSVLLMNGIGLSYQFFIHTEAVRAFRPPPYE